MTPETTSGPHTPSGPDTPSSPDLPSTPDATTITVDGPVGDLRVYLTHDGAAATPALFIHPLNMAAAAWLDVAALLDRPSLALDLRGHGHSTLRGPFTVNDYADDVLAVLDAQQVDAVHLVGGSIGGAVAMSVAARAPDRVRTISALGSALFLDVPPAALEEMTATLLAVGVREYFAPQASAVLAPGSDPRIAELLIELAVGPPSARRRPELVADILRSGFASDVRLQAGDVRCRSLVVVGEHDPTCPPAAAAQLAAGLRTEPILLADTGHAPMLERPAEVADLLNAHLWADEA